MDLSFGGAGRLTSFEGSLRSFSSCMRCFSSGVGAWRFAGPDAAAAGAGLGDAMECISSKSEDDDFVNNFREGAAALIWYLTGTSQTQTNACLG